MTRIKQLGPRALPVLLVGVFLIGVSPAMTEECSPPCTTTRNGLPTFRLINTANGDSWDLESSAFGLELIDVGNDTPANGALRIEEDANANTLVIDDSGRVGIGTTAPLAELQINDVAPNLRLNDTSSGAGQVDFVLSTNTFFLRGNSGQSVVEIDTQAQPLALNVVESGRVGLGAAIPLARLHVAGDARVEGDISIASSRSLKTAFGSIDTGEVLASVADLPLASWHYASDDETARHIGPFAEDFQRLFGVGDGETISVIDAQGVTFAAIQELAERNAALHRDLDDQSAEIQHLRARLRAIEMRLTREPQGEDR